MYLNELKATKGANKRRKIVGRGKGSGHGETSGRGENGQKSRSGRGIVGSSEGGQMPLIRRLPKVGFRSHRPILNQVVKFEKLNAFDNGTVITKELLKKTGLIKSINKPFKILGTGEITKSLTFKVESISESAKVKIIKAGGKVEVFEKVVKEDVKKGKK